MSSCSIPLSPVWSYIFLCTSCSKCRAIVPHFDFSLANHYRAAFANHCSTFANFNSSSQDLCEEVPSPLYRQETKTSKICFQKHTVASNAQCEMLRDVFQNTWNSVLGTQRHHVREKIMRAHVISTRSWCKQARVISNFRGYPYVCHCPMRFCVSSVICSQYSLTFMYLSLHNTCLPTKK